MKETNNVISKIEDDYFYKLIKTDTEKADRVACNFLDYLWEQHKILNKDYCFSYYLHILLKYFFINNVLPTEFILKYKNYRQQNIKFETCIINHYFFMSPPKSEREVTCFCTRTDRIVSAYIDALNNNPFRQELNLILESQFNK